MVEYRQKITYNDILVSLDLIRYENFGTYYFKDDPKSTTRLTPNFYTLFDGDDGKARKNLAEGYKLYKITEGGNAIFTDKPLVMDNRSIGGEKGSLMKKEMNGSLWLVKKVELLNLIVLVRKKVDKFMKLNIAVW